MLHGFAVEHSATRIALAAHREKFFDPLVLQTKSVDNAGRAAVVALALLVAHQLAVELVDQH